MNIRFTAPVLPVDEHAQRAFIEILNIVLLSRHVVELNRLIIRCNTDSCYRSLSGYFRWSFAGCCFTLWQRTAFGSDVCFPQEILSLHFSTLVARDRSLQCPVV